MSKYRPGTLDNDAVLLRRRSRQRDEVRASLAPTGSQVFGTTEKVRGFDISISDAKKAAEDAVGKVKEMMSVLDDALSIGTVVLRATESPPAHGEWSSIGTVDVAGKTLHAYERTA